MSGIHSHHARTAPQSGSTPAHPQSSIPTPLGCPGWEKNAGQILCVHCEASSCVLRGSFWITCAVFPPTLTPKPYRQRRATRMRRAAGEIHFLKHHSCLGNLISAPTCRSSRLTQSFLLAPSRSCPCAASFGLWPHLLLSWGDDEAFFTLKGRYRIPHLSCHPWDVEHTLSHPWRNPGSGRKFTIKFISGHVGGDFLNWDSLPAASEIRVTKQGNPKGNQPWMFTGRTDAEAEAPILWPPDELIH